MKSDGQRCAVVLRDRTNGNLWYAALWMMLLIVTGARDYLPLWGLCTAAVAGCLALKCFGGGSVCVVDADGVRNDEGRIAWAELVEFGARHRGDLILGSADDSAEGGARLELSGPFSLDARSLGYLLALAAGRGSLADNE